MLFRDQMEEQMWANSIFFWSIWSLNNIEQYYLPKEDGISPHLWFHLVPKEYTAILSSKRRWN
jgi:hypothetical protein